MASKEQVESAKALGFEIRDPQRFAQNMAQLIGETGKAVLALAEPHATGAAPNPALSDDLAPVARTFARLQQSWLTQPGKLLDAQTKLWFSHLDLWNESVRQMMALGSRQVAPANPKDSRFKD